MTIYLADRGTVRWKLDSNFGGISDASLDPSGAYDWSDAIALPVEMMEVVEAEPELRERNEMRSRRGRRRSHRIGPRISGAKKVRRTATFTARMVIHGVGSGDSDDHPLVPLLSAMLADGGAPAWTEDAVQTYHAVPPGSTAANEFYFYPEDVSRFAEGQLCSVDIDGRAVPIYVVALDATGGSEWVQILGAPRHLTDGDIVRSVRTFEVGSPEDRDAGSLRFDKPGYRMDFFGVRITEAKFSVQPKGDESVLVFEFSFDARYVRPNHGSVSVIDPVSPGAGPELQFNGGTVEAGAALPVETTAGPYSVARVGTLNVAQLDVTITAEIADAPDQLTVLAGQSVVRDVMCDAAIVLSQPLTVFDADLEGDTDRWFSCAIGSPGAGNALVMFMPTALANDDRANRGENDELLIQNMTFQDGEPRGTATASESDSSFVIGLVL